MKYPAIILCLSLTSCFYVAPPAEKASVLQFGGFTYIVPEKAK